MFSPSLQIVFATEAPGIVGQGQTRRKVLTQFSVASGNLYIDSLIHTSKETTISSSIYFLTVFLQPSQPLLLIKVL